MGPRLLICPPKKAARERGTLVPLWNGGGRGGPWPLLPRSVPQPQVKEEMLVPWISLEFSVPRGFICFFHESLFFFFCVFNFGLPIKPWRFPPSIFFFQMSLSHYFLFFNQWHPPMAPPRVVVPRWERVPLWGPRWASTP